MANLDWSKCPAVESVPSRLIQHLQRRSQRPFRPPEGMRSYEYFRKVGLISLARSSESGKAQA